MTFSVKLSNQATKFLNKQDAHIRERIKTALQKLKEPFQFVEHFEGEDYYKFRVGDYRALVDIDTPIKLRGFDSSTIEGESTNAKQTGYCPLLNVCINIYKTYMV